MSKEKKTTLEIITADNGVTIHIKIGNKVIASRVFFQIPGKPYLNRWINKCKRKYKETEFRKNNPIVKIN